ncbi:tRNA lysidine(34) synthetase TilS [Rhodopila globiformis]|uniref:tRNA(Ile)-lysidine synthase n=2 Tax=Rhodopila globiformis TaxID=1071 RepID=A0A2S6MWR6_RHOGL|nr:tRNA lysidine(34) synthetase TilS [Rhodopila globiformis]
MDRLGPYAPEPALAVAASGGADSTALAVLAKGWADSRQRRLCALVVDHGLRSESAAEAVVTVERVTRLGIPARLLTLTTLARGPALAERARLARYQVLFEACREAGCRDLLLGHHAADQAETVAMRILRNSGTHGLAGMAASREVDGLRLLRPLLAFPPKLLRHYLTERGIGWIEDPSNRDLRAQRPRLRQLFTGTLSEPTLLALTQAISGVGRLRADEEAETAAELAERAAIHPEGFALLSPGRISEAALSNLVQTIGGAAYPPSPAQIAPLAAEPKPATLGGVRILPAGRLGPGWLVVREEAAIAPPIDATPGAVWDNRFRLIVTKGSLAGATIGKLGADAARFRARSNLPSIVLRTLPAIRLGKIVAAVPHLGYGIREDDVQIAVPFVPVTPVAGSRFVPADAAGPNQPASKMPSGL